MQKNQFKIAMDEDVQKRLHAIGERYGMSGNAIVAAAAYELSRIQPEQLWHALGRIAADEGGSLMPADAESLPRPAKRVRQALPASV